ncbi:MAG: ABC transporter ATP-binding protein [Alphaproteobacteria bacterium]|nr:ABC transporter ATP-binding protein [Alphaproteobacteria bacterium]
MSAGAVRLEDLTLGYQRHPAVHHVSGSFAPGSLTAIAGPNGAGKSTLLKGIAGELRPLSGRIALDGLKPRDIAYLPQIAEIERRFPVSVLDLVALGAWRRAGLFRSIGRDDLALAHHAVDTVGLSGFEDRPIGTLSGGQLQRALFARLLVQDARLILLDEPFAAIDQGTTADLVEILKRWRGEGRTVIAVLHDDALMRAHFPETLLLARACVAWGATEEALRPEHLLAARRMCEAFHDDAAVCRP